MGILKGLKGIRKGKDMSFPWPPCDAMGLQDPLSEMSHSQLT